MSADIYREMSRITIGRSDFYSQSRIFMWPWKTQIKTREIAISVKRGKEHRLRGR